MTRHTHITSRYVPQTGDDAAIQLNAFLNRLTEQLSAASGHLTAEALRHMIMEARKWPPPNDPKMEGQGRGIPCGGVTVNYVAPADHWSPWLEWRGGPCPLPPYTDIEWEHVVGALAGRGVIWPAPPGSRFRYRADNPGGWLPRGEFIPPAELWAPECPVRAEFAEQKGDKFECGIPRGAGTHIRLVAREAKAGLPEGFRISAEGSLYARRGIIFTKGELEKHGPAAIRQAVDAWLREMGDE